MPSLPFIDRVSRGVGYGLSTLFLVAVLMTVYEVVMRYVFNAPTIWVHDMVTTVTAVAFIFGGALVSQQRLHIQMASYADRLPHLWHKRVDLLCHLLMALYLALFIYGALILAVPSIKLMETSGRAWDVPIPMFLKTALALGAILMLLQTLSHIRRRTPLKPDSGEIVI